MAVNISDGRIAVEQLRLAQEQIDSEVKMSQIASDGFDPQPRDNEVL